MICDYGLSYPYFSQILWCFYRHLLGLTENKKSPNTDLSELHLSDDTLDLLKSGQINNRLLCEIATHKDFIKLLTDTEIYVDGIATMRIRDLNDSLEIQRAEIIHQYQPEVADLILQAIEAAKIQEEDFFCHVTHKTWDNILHDLRIAHEKDIEPASTESNSQMMLKSIRQALAIPGDNITRFCAIIYKTAWDRLFQITKR